MKNESKNIGCGKIFLYACALFLILTLLSGILEGVGKIFSEIPWYGHIFLSIGFVYLILKFTK